MPKVSDVTRYVRSKVAGPFWVTIDVFFDSPESFAKYHDNKSLRGASIAKLYGVSEQYVKHIPVPSLSMVKISYPRRTAAGWIEERDLHSGQQFAQLLDVDLD